MEHTFYRFLTTGQDRVIKQVRKALAQLGTPDAAACPHCEDGMPMSADPTHHWTGNANPPECTNAAQAAEYPNMAKLREQAISFAYGNCSIENPAITREMVAQAYDELHPEERQPEV